MLRALRHIWHHPLSRRHRLAALNRYFRWQLGSRLLHTKVLVPFVGDTRLAVQTGMAGATGNIYVGLHEFEDMAFVLHALAPGDLFVDVGANIGSYTVLAAGVCRANVCCFEPSPATFPHLLDNIHVNNLDQRVTAINSALGATRGTVRFTSGLDTTNHVASGESEGASVEVDVVPLDEIVADRSPAIIKIDVEGFETEVIRGAARTLAAPSLMAVLMELNGSGNRYGYDEKRLHQQMLDGGFVARRYLPFERRLLPAEPRDGPNTLYVRSEDVLAARLKNGAPVHVHGVTF